MANYQQLKEAIQTAINNNGRGAITGQVLQDVLINIVEKVGFGYVYAGFATPTTAPQYTDSRVFYLVTKGGTYPSFGGVVVREGLSVLKYDTRWQAQLILAADQMGGGGSSSGKGLFPTENALNAAFPTPEVGWYAIVGTTSPYALYDCVTSGVWHNTGETTVIAGIKGDKGDDGKDGEKGAPFTYNDFTPEQLEALKGEDGRDGVDGADGADGVGIESVSKTASSNEDGGTNTWQITLTNGNTIYISINNGHTGATGPQGESVIVGQGDLPLVHVLGKDTTKAMSQKGVTDEILRVEIWEETQVTPSGGKNSIINSSGNWQSGASAYRNCYLTPILPNRTYRIVKGNYPFQIMLLTNNTVTAGSAAPFATGESYRDYVSDDELFITTPSDAAYMYIRHLDGSSSSNAYDRTPSRVALVEYVKEHISKIDGLLDTVKNIVDNIYCITEYGYANKVRYNGYQVGATVTVSTNISNVAGAKVPCEPGDIFIMNGTGKDATRIYVFTDENNVILAVSARNITLNNYSVKAPEGACFLYSTIYTPDPYSNIIRRSGKIDLRLLNVESSMEYVSNKVNSILSKEEIAWESPKRYGGATLGYPISTESSTVGYAARKVACQPGDTFLLTSTGADNFRLFYWLDEEELCIDRSLPNISVNDFLLVAPPNAAWLIVNCYPSSDPHSLYKISGVAKEMEENKPSRDTVKILYNNALHKEKVSSVRFSAPSATESRGNTLTLMHFSDLHDNFNAARRMAEYFKSYAPYIDDVINTGDTMHTHYSGEYVFATVWAHYNDFGKNILTVIGNHDSRANDDSSWYANAGINCYNKFIAPSVENWGVVQPEDAATLGKCYYYKDYVEKGIRLIVLDNMVMTGENYDQSQITWFVNVLSDAIANNLSVVAAKHYSANVVPFEGAWHERNATDMSACSVFYNAIDSFISNGGSFICWISGHTHYNVLGTIDSHPNQLSIAVGSCVVDNYQYSTREGAAQDCFNLISFDTTQKRIKVLRVGNTIDWKLRHHELLCIDYNTRTIISSI